MVININNEGTDLQKTKDTKIREAKKISRRDVVKIAWTAPLVMAAAPPLRVLAGSGGAPPRPTDPPPTDPPPTDPPPEFPPELSEWDRSSIVVSGAGCSSDGSFMFEIKNGGDGDMEYSHEWRAYVMNGGSEGAQIASGSFKLDSGESIIVTIKADVEKIRLYAEQHPQHGNPDEPDADHEPNRPRADVSCGSSDSGDDEESGGGKGRGRNK